MISFEKEFIAVIILAVGIGVAIAFLLLSKKQKPKPLMEDHEKIRAAVEPIVLSGPVVPPPKTKNSVEEKPLKSMAEFPIDAKLQVEFSRITKKEGNVHKRIVQSRGVARIKLGGFGGGDLTKLLFIVTPKAAYYVNPTKIIRVTLISKKLIGKAVTSTIYKLVFDPLYSEALNQDGSITYDDELESILANSAMDQYITVAAFEGTFQLTPTLKKVLMIVGGLALLWGLALNGALHIVPTTIVHWIPVK